MLATYTCEPSDSGDQSSDQGEEEACDSGDRGPPSPSGSTDTWKTKVWNMRMRDFGGGGGSKEEETIDVCGRE